MLSGIGRNLRRSSSYLTAQQTRHSNYTVTTTISQQSTILHLLFPCIELLELLHKTKGQGQSIYRHLQGAQAQSFSLHELTQKGIQIRN